MNRTQWYLVDLTAIALGILGYVAFQNELYAIGVFGYFIADRSLAYYYTGSITGQPSDTGDPNGGYRV